MSKIKLNLRNLSPTETVAKARQIVTGLMGNPGFTTPHPALSQIMTAADDVETAVTDLQTARQAVATKQSVQQDKLDILGGLLRQSAAYIESIAGKDETLIISTGLSVRSTTTSTPTVTTPASLTASTGEHEGEIRLSWGKVKSAKSYIIERSPDPPTNTSWTHAAVSPKASVSISGLTSGTRYWFRVAAVMAGGQSGWSDPATKIAP
jgi:hypothetical protein